jgi:serine/threonine protein kinase/Flp pilus assembly protein TadD
MSNSVSVASGSLDALIGQVADEFLQRQKSGESPDPEEYAARHPEAAELIRNVLRSLRLIEESAGGAGTSDEPLAGTLGDYRLIREVGRGGMGVVYEAEQISLGRRVALKVLPFAATMDARHLQRFHNEARAAASLHHEHIVPVYAVGCERGVHFYAMQFIEGLTLAQVISRQDAAGETTAPHAAGADDTTPRPAATETPRDAAFFRRAAEWGAQAAEALEHAHSLGVVHRDVKPGNLMIDAQGKLWVADFGLARTAAEGNLTMTGDVLGTLRYTSPEQALAKHGLVDHRTDVYALGATLYELLTGRPAVEGRDRAEILLRVASEEPVPPRRHERAVPTDLQTVVLKALSKDPLDRYRSAGELAADLRRFLEDRPLKARPPSAAKRLSRLLRRHRIAAVASVVGLLVCLTALAGSIGWALRDRADRQARATWAAERKLEESEVLLRGQKPREARAAAEQALVFVEQAGGRAGLAEQARLLQGQADVALAMEEFRLREADPNKDMWSDRDETPYRDAFAGHGIDVLALGVEDAAARIRSGAIAWALVPALDDWRACARDAATRRHLLAVAQVADPDPLRTRIRDATAARRDEELVTLPRYDQVLEISPGTLHLLGRALEELLGNGEAVALLRRAQQRHPADFWLNAQLASFLLVNGEAKPDEAVGFFRAAVALRPGSPKAHNLLGSALLKQGKAAGAVACFREAIRLKPDYAEAHNNLGVALAKQGKPVAAVASHREAIRLKPDFATAHTNLGVALRAQGKAAEAWRDFEAHYNLGNALHKQGKAAEAEGCFRQAIRLKPDLAEAHGILGGALLEQGKAAEAEGCFRQAIRLKPDLADAHVNLGVALLKQGKAAEAEGCFRQAICLKPYFTEAHRGLGGAHFNLGLALHGQGRIAEALRHFYRAHELGSPDPGMSEWSLRFARWARRSRRLLELEGNLPAVLAGKLQPATPDDTIAYAEMCQLYKHRHAAAARLYQDAFDASPDPRAAAIEPHRYNAACAAALAGCGQGEDSAGMSQSERNAWRRQALTWLRASLRPRARLIRNGTATQRAQARAELAHWREDTDLAGVRGEKALAGLSAEEAKAWRDFWADVDALRPRELPKR